LNSKNTDIKGLVLAGGKSRRMGNDKAYLNYGKSAQFNTVYTMLDEICSEVFVSCKAHQEFPYQVINDNVQYNEIGPAAGLMSAFEHSLNPWFVVAIDYPFLDLYDLKLLMKNRDSSSLATVFYNPESNFYEPLIGIYEKGFYETLSQEVSKGNSSLQSILRKHTCKKVIPKNLKSIQSVDTKEQFNEIKLRQNHE
jgi:molybdopterin-guanine dinucleotide biosynthesis protein A